MSKESKDNKNLTTVKILISYHKPAVLLKDEVLTPIHVGRALATESSKDGSMSEEDYKWMLENMIGDDTGDNISHLNRTLNELTSMYWAWKNYDKLGNPDYIGFMHYRRIFDFLDKSKFLPINRYLGIRELENLDEGIFRRYYDKEKILEIVKDNKYIISEHHKSNPYNHYKTASKYCHIEDYDKCLQLIEKYFPEYKEASDIYNKGNKSYFCNMFIMPKNEFFSLCDFLFKIIFKLQKEIDFSNYNIQGSRVLAYISEWLVAIFFTNLKIKNNIEIKEIPPIYIKDTDTVKELYPKNKDSICICFACNDAYAIYLEVTLKSLIENSNKNNYYEIYIFETNIAEPKKQKILSMTTDNINIKFINVTKYIRNVDKIKFFIHRHFSVEAYYRIFIPRIFKNFNKILYLDIDIIILDDIANLYNSNTNNKMLSAVLDIEIIRAVYNKSFAKHKITFTNYVTNDIKLKNIYNYFQSGVLLFDIKKCINFNLEEKFLEKLNEIKEPVNIEQDILNSICQENINFLDLSWNVEWILGIYYNNLEDMLPVKIYNEYIKAYNNPKIIHYCDRIKPWNSPYYQNANIWWKYARMVDSYEEIVYHNIWNRNHNNYNNYYYTDNRISIADFILSFVNNENELSIMFLGIKIRIKKNFLQENYIYYNKKDRIFSIYSNDRYTRLTILGIKITIKKR